MNENKKTKKNYRKTTRLLHRCNLRSVTSTIKSAGEAIAGFSEYRWE